MTPTAQALAEVDSLLETQGRLLFARENYNDAEATDFGVRLLDFMRRHGVIVRQALAQLGGGRDWLPIESAPKDGTGVLLSNGVDVAHGHWFHEEAYIRENRDLDGRWIGQDESEGYDGWIDWNGGMSPDPTHWQPLPPAPTEPAQAGRDGGVE